MKSTSLFTEISGSNEMHFRVFLLQERESVSTSNPTNVGKVWEPRAQIAPNFESTNRGRDGVKLCATDRPTKARDSRNYSCGG